MSTDAPSLQSTPAGTGPSSSAAFSLADYHAFIESKRVAAVPSGFEVHTSRLNPLLKSWQALIVQWALRLGKASIFAYPGLGKTFMQLVWAEQVYKHTGQPVLILCPLGVRHQTLQEAEKFGIDCPVNISQTGLVRDGITITNYHRVHLFDTSVFSGIVPDESGCLQDFTSKTTEELTDRFSRTPYKLPCTATPAPNDHMELGTHAEFCGAMGRNEMLAMFFTHDGGDTSKWRLKGHAQHKFWEWMASWSVMLRTPADIGFPDNAYDLPPLNTYEHIVDTPIVKGHLFQASASTLKEQRDARRETIDHRIAKMLELIDPSRPFAVFCNLNDESAAATKALAHLGAIEITGSNTDDQKEMRLKAFADGSAMGVVSKPSICGRGLNWQHCSQAFCLGLSHSWSDFFQLVSRFRRFGQEHPVDIHVIVSDRDDIILKNIKRKQADADRMAEGMVKAMAGFTRENLKAGRVGAGVYQPKQKLELPAWI